jgi:Sec-independent protein translocase protein TatA
LEEKIEMSFSELLVIVIVGVLLLKPEDLPKILRKLKELQSFINNTRREIFSHINLEESSNKAQELKENISEVNFYLEKISGLGGEYQGEYSLDEIKKHYHSLVKKQIASDREKDKIEAPKT